MFQLDLGLWTMRKPRPQPRITAPSVPASKALPWKHGIIVHIVTSPKARRYLLRLEPDGSARLVIPRRGSRAEALRFLERSEGWLLRRQAQWQNRRQERLPWLDGSPFLFRGEEVILRVEAIDDRVRLSFGAETISLPHALADFREPVFRHMRRLAERELPPRTLELARLHHITIQRVTIRAQKTRWGSCSARGTISLNWRILHAPASVQDYLIIHELMHRREMNHSARYWKLVEQACPDFRAAEAWLKKQRLE